MKRAYTGDNTCKVSVIIPTKNAGPGFSYTLEKLRNQKGIPDIEIILVDSGSCDETLEIAQQYSAIIHQIHPDEFHHAKTRNRAADLASGNYLFFTVQDAIPIGEYLISDMVNVIIKNNNVCAVSCRQVPRSDADLFACYSLYVHYNSIHFTQDRISYSSQYDDRLDPKTRQRLTGLDNVCCLIERDIFFNLKFDDIPFAEDINLGIRLLKNKKNVAFLYSSGVIHSHNRDPVYFMKSRYVASKILAQLFGYQYPPVIVCDHLQEFWSYVSGSYSLLLRAISSLSSAVVTDGIINEMFQHIQSDIKKNMSNTHVQLSRMRDTTDDLHQFIYKMSMLSGTVEPKIHSCFMEFFFSQLENFNEYCSIYPSLEKRGDEYIRSVFKLFASLIGPETAQFLNHLTVHGIRAEGTEEIDALMSEGI
jgi:rhamnosyltransferase